MGERTRAPGGSGGLHPNDGPSPEFRILGPLEAVAGGRSLDLGSPKQRDLLAILLINAGRVVSTAQLADDLWSGEPPDRPEPTLQAYVSRLRKVLGAERLVTRAPGYMLAVRPDDVDAMRFERLLTSGRDARTGGEPDRARALLHEALALWRGRALDGVRFLAAEQEAARLEALRVECVEERIDAELALGAGAELVAELQTLNAAEPLGERIAAQLATALYRAGRQSEALDVLQNVAHELREQLGVDPSPALRALEESILRHEDVLAHRPTVYVRTEVGAEPRGFIGREDELAAIADALHDPGLLTLTGLGGTGKTRLALAAAAAWADEATVALLAPLRDGELVYRAIATSLGVGESPGRRIEDLVTEHLASSSGLLVLDNCEHLRAHVSDVVIALGAVCPDLRIIATSREPLAVAKERVWSVPPMQPEDASKLFVQRATTANPDVLLPFDAVERICARVGGIPLAVELAAARTRVLTVEQIAERLGDVVRTIDPDERLASALSWAVEELGPREQLLLGRLAVFAGSFTLEDAEAVAPVDGLDVADVLTSAGRLVEMSLLATEPDGNRMRYRMLEPVRQFVTRRDADRSSLAARHFTWAMSTAQTDHDERVDRSMDDIRAALTWSVTEANDPSRGLELACTMAGHWRIHGYWQEGMRWLGSAILAAPADDSCIRAAHRRYSELAYAGGHGAEAVAHARTAIAMSEAAEDHHELAWATQSLAVALHREDLDAAAELYERALVAARKTENETLVMQLLHNIGTQKSESGDNPAARVRFEEALAIAERRDDHEAIVIITQCLARLAVNRQEFDEARRLLDASLVLARRSRIARGIIHGLFVHGHIASTTGDYARAHAYYEELMEAERQAGDRIGELEAMLCVADAQEKRGMIEESLSTAFASRDLAEAIAMPRYTAMVHEMLGNLHMTLGDLGRAAVHLADALVEADGPSASRWFSRARGVGLLLSAGGAHQHAATLISALDVLLRADERAGIDDYDYHLADALREAREQLGPRFDEFAGRGSSMTREEASAYALDALRETFTR